MKPGQKGIYYLLAPTRSSALSSPYYEPFKLQNIEVRCLIPCCSVVGVVCSQRRPPSVQPGPGDGGGRWQVLLLHDPVDEFVINSLRQFDGKDFINIDAEDVDIGQEATNPATALSDADAAVLVGWFKDTLGSSVADVKVRARGSGMKKSRSRTRLTTTLGAICVARHREGQVSRRLVNHPAMVVGHDSPTMRNMLKMLDPTTAASIRPLPATHVRRVFDGVRTCAPRVCAQHGGRCRLI